MKRLVRLPRAAAYLFVIWCVSPFSAAWVTRLRRKCCAGIGVLLPGAIIVTDLRFRWPGIFSFSGAAATLKGMEAEVRQLTFSLDIRALLHGTFRLKMLRAASIRVRAKKPAPVKGPQKKEKAIAGIRPRVYRQIIGIFRSTGAIPPVVSIGSLDIGLYGLKCCMKEIRYMKGAFGLDLITAHGREGCRVKGLIDPVTYKTSFWADRFAAGGEQRYAASGPFSLEICCPAAGVLQVNANADDVLLKWPALAADPVTIDKMSAALHFRLNAESFVLEDPSAVCFNGLECSLYASHAFPAENIFRIIVETGESTFDVLLKAFPPLKKLLPHSFTGHLPPVSISFAASIDNPYQYLLETGIGEGMQLAAAGDWPDIRGPFTHEVFENGSFVTSLDLWPGSGDFRPLDSLPDMLTAIVVASEDPTFYTHNGMDPFFLGYAIADNIAERKFSRGGSTVTMQLARNLFLDHHKTIFRKLEEIMIALLLENVCQVPKSRILELYLNIIEFAPGVYGITEAAKYYFGKEPEMLSLSDCLVLSYIIPRPKFFMDAVAAGAGQLRKNLALHMKSGLRMLVGSGKVSEEEARAVSSALRIRGYELQLA